MERVGADSKLFKARLAKMKGVRKKGRAEKNLDRLRVIFERFRATGGRKMTLLD